MSNAKNPAPVQVALSTGATIPFRPYVSTTKGKTMFGICEVTPQGNRKVNRKVLPVALGGSLPTSLNVAGVTIVGVQGVTDGKDKTVKDKKTGRTKVVPATTPAGLPKVTFSGRITLDGKEQSFLFWVHDWTVIGKDYYKVGGGITDPFGNTASAPAESL